MGWTQLIDIIKAAEEIKTSFSDKLFLADWIAIDFAEASRLNEALASRIENFIEYPGYFKVEKLPVSKRYDKIGQSIICRRCGRENNEFEVQCLECGANLIFGGKRKYKTRKKHMFRIPFKIPKSEPTTKYLIRRLEIAKDNEWEYLFYNPHTKKPITDSCIYSHYSRLGKVLGIDLWCHRNRAERAKQLVEDYGFTKDDLKRYMMIVEDKTLNFYAGTSIPYERKMGIQNAHDPRS